VLGDAVDGRVLDALAGTGLRHGHGYIVQRLLVGPATATEIAQDLGVTQQAVSKAVKELEVLGHVAAVADPSDRRRRPVRLTARGHEAVRVARATRAQIDATLRDALGDAAFDDTMAALRVVMEALDLADRVDRRAVRPAAPTLD
jgi:DNA-binding MarR family transcriptional regulator